ncbi:HicA family toxin-antitoxin system [Virgibacillus necropolis]|uniref:HicA family toxin-antitoxin system n=1 Tax=Virgibacillus necropolis TaxID=163877 RepID=A0A221MH27_9BACI|nr:HicA family toxin-antitoxin system [Virgibacillus necropolis]ASN06945.1 HicA family toxin-antitoxin system [Virgibacillus necropolis]
MNTLVDDFEVETVYEDRTYARYRFVLLVDGVEYKGDFHEGEIQWLHPHPKQTLNEGNLKWIEAEVHELIGEHVSNNGESEDDDDIEVTPLLNDQSHTAHQFRLTIEGDEYKGIFRDDKMEWFHPKPRRKLKDEDVEEIEEKIHEKMKEHLDE